MNPIRALPLLVIAALCACTSAQLQTAQTDVAQAQVVVNAAACDAQKAANEAGAAALAVGQAKAASDASLVSQATGALCVTLAPVPAPAPLAPAS